MLQDASEVVNKQSELQSKSECGPSEVEDGGWKASRVDTNYRSLAAVQAVVLKHARKVTLKEVEKMNFS